MGMSRRAIFLTLLFCFSQAAFAFEEEIKFVKGLTEAGFPKLARTVLNRTLKEFPEAETAAPELRIRILIAEKDFDRAAQQIKALQNPPRPASTPPEEGNGKTPLLRRGGRSEATDGVGLWLFLAETAHAARQLSTAETAYQNYFKNLTADDDATGQAAFNYGELLEKRGNGGAAKAIYEKALKLTDSRPVKTKLAALLVDDAPDRALKLSEEVQLGGLDLWFGQAVVIWSQLMIDKEDWGEARAVLEMQLELLKQLEDSLAAQGRSVSLISPLSGARYLLGVCYEHEGLKAEALHQFYNVTIQYGDSEWGPNAQERAQKLIAHFEGQGQTVKIDLGTNRAKMEGSCFRVARRLFFDRQYAAAIPAYLDALNKFPEGVEAITALRELCLSSIHLDDDLGAKTVGLYLAERFATHPKAGGALLAAGKGALDQKRESLAWWMYDRAIENFPAHSRMPAVLYSLAGLRKEERYLNRIVENYPDSRYHARALGRLAWNAFEAEEYEAAAARFALYLETESDPQKQTRARFAFAESWRFMAQQDPSLRSGSAGVPRHSLLTSAKGIAPPVHSKSLGRASLSERAVLAWENALQHFQTLEQSMAGAAGSYGVSKETLTFNQPFWEKSIYYQAVCQKELGEPSAAVQTCDRFLEAFPESEFVPQVRFTKGKTLIGSERFAEALAAFEPFGEATDHPFAEPVFYYRGIAQFETGDPKAAIQTLETLLTRWPASALTYEAMFVQGRAYVAAGQSDNAIRVLGDILNFASDDLLIHRASLELGRAQTDAAEKLASFQRVALLADPDNEEHAPLIAAALFESLPLYLELTRHNDLLADAERLLHEFPSFAKASEGEPPLGKTKEIKALQKKAEQMQKESTADHADENGSK